MRIPNILKPSKKKTILLVILIILAIVGFNFFGQKKQAPLQFASVKKQDIKSTVSSSGILTGKDSAILRFKASGKLSYLNVKTGDKVYTGQALAGLDSQAQSINLQQTQNTLRDKQAIVDKIHDDVKDHSSDESFTLRQTRTTAEVAKDNAFDAVREAQRAFQDTIIISPLEGIVTQVTTSVPGQNVSSSDTIIQVVDFSGIYFDTDIDEADISKISLDQKAEVTLDAYSDRVFQGSVFQITPQTKITSSGATVITVKIKFEKTDITAINGLSGESSIILSEAKNVLTIPQESLREDNTVFIQENQNLRSKKVEVGIKSDTDVEIKSGLSTEDKVLLNPPSIGTRVSPQNRNPIQSAIFRVFGTNRGNQGGQGGRQ